MTATAAHQRSVRHTQVSKASAARAGGLHAAVGLAVVFSILKLTTSDAHAEEWKTFTSPVAHGFVVRYRHPASWTARLGTGGPHSAAVLLYDTPKKRVRFGVYLGDNEDFWVKNYKAPKKDWLKRYFAEELKRFASADYKRQFRTFRTKITTYLSEPALYYEYTLRRDGLHTGPIFARWETVLRNRYSVSVRFETGHPDLFKRWIAHAKKIAASVQVIPLSKLKPNESVLYTFRSKRVRLSLRSGYYLDGRLLFYHERRWKPAIRRFRHADEGTGRGQMVVEFLDPRPRPGGRYRSRVVIALTGLPVVPQPLSGFLNTTPVLIGQWFGKPTKIDQKTANIGGLRFLARSAPRRGESTRVTYVRTYRVAKPDGRKLMVKAYTAGGMSAAVNVFVVAEKDAFKRHLATTDGWARAVHVWAYSSAFRYGPR